MCDSWIQGHLILPDLQNSLKQNLFDYMKQAVKKNKKTLNLNNPDLQKFRNRQEINLLTFISPEKISKAFLLW